MSNASADQAGPGISNDPGFDVIDESDDHVAVNKPAPLLVHPSVPGNPRTLLDGVRDLLAYEIANGAAPSLVNRLDRETSGVVLLAKHKAAARRFGLAMQNREFDKQYLALVRGQPETRTFTVDTPLRRAGEVRESAVWVRQIPHPQGTPCHTDFEFLERRGEFSLLRAFPRTGRMHQIRAHLEHAGLPIVGDKIYGGDESCYLEFIETGWTDALAARLLLPRQALHCSRMSLPDYGSWDAPLPPELARFGTAP